MPVPSYQITCTLTKLIASQVYELRFTKPAGFTFKPGQFVLLDVSLVADAANIQTRALSIASSPDEDDLLFVVKLIPGGRISTWIEKLLHEGTEVRMQGPFGNFVLDRKTDKEFLFVATSTGNAPFRAFLRDVLQQGDTRRMDFVFGVRSEEDLFWGKEFQDLATQYNNFFLHVALSNPAQTWTGHKGRVQTLVPQIVKDFSHKAVYVCGSPEMTKELKDLCLNEWGILKTDLHVEGYM